MTASYFTQKDIAKMVGALVGGLYLSGEAGEDDIRAVLALWASDQPWPMMQRYRRAMDKVKIEAAGTNPEGK